jgi:hypothetical protein
MEHAINFESIKGNLYHVLFKPILLGSISRKNVFTFLKNLLNSHCTYGFNAITNILIFIWKQITFPCFIY